MSPFPVSLKNIYTLIETSTIEELIIYTLVLYIFGGLIKQILGVEFEVNEKLKTSPKIALGLVLIYISGAIGILTNKIFNFSNYLDILVVDLLVLIVILMVFRVVVFEIYLPRYAGNKHSKHLMNFRSPVDLLENFEKEDYKRDAIKVINGYTQLWKFLMINILASLVVLIYFIRLNWVLAPFVGLICFMYNFRSFNDYRKKNGGPSENIDR